MTFAGVKDIGVMSPGVPLIFRYSVGQSLFDSKDPRFWVIAIDYNEGVLLYAPRIAPRPFWQRLRSAWRVLRGGLP
jgi:hypothetical protein